MTFYIDADYISLNHVGEELCGDKVEMVRTGEASIFVLSDGLGSCRFLTTDEPIWWSLTGRSA